MSLRIVEIFMLLLQTAARIWDCLLGEGTKILYRVSLALLKLYESDLLRIDNAGDLIARLRQRTQQLHDRDMLMKVPPPPPSHESSSDPKAPISLALVSTEKQPIIY